MSHVHCLLFTLLYLDIGFSHENLEKILYFIGIKSNLLLVFLQVFFVIHLHSGPMVNTLPPIIDPDPNLTCDLMDGRDAFLTLARDKHWEFSSLRRCKWSTMCMLVELHNQGQDRFVYTCNECKHHVETRWHCTVCEVRDRSNKHTVAVVVVSCVKFLGTAC